MPKMGQSRNGLLTGWGLICYMFGSVTYAKTTPAAEVAGWSG
jgi:hypothetical protein